MKKENVYEKRWKGRREERKMKKAAAYKKNISV
jgi:hypothetical protein